MPVRSFRIALVCCALLGSCDSDSTTENQGLDLATVAIDGRPFRVDSVCATLDTGKVLSVSIEKNPLLSTRQHMSILIGPLSLGGFELSDLIQGGGTAWYQDESHTTPDGPATFRPSLNFPGTLTVTSWDPATHTVAASFSFLARQYVPLGVDSTLAIAGRFQIRYVTTCS